VTVDTVTVDFVWAILGAAILLAIIGLLRRGRYARP
jgi:uncharacterized membrane protein YeaQ/YmgE (transglycosylase-associated protein family)